MTGLPVDFDGAQAGITRDRYGFHAAIITRDGRPTTFDCSHNHHTADLAGKCVRKVRSNWRRWTQDDLADDIRLVRIDGLHIVFECAVPPQTKRFRVCLDQDELAVVEVWR